MNSERSEDQSAEHHFLIRCAEMLHVHGTPAHRLERVMVTVAKSLGVEASFLYTPTSVFASFGKIPNEETHLLRTSSCELDLGKLVEFDELMESVESGALDVVSALAKLDEIDGAPPRWNSWWRALAFGLVSAGAARFFDGGLPELTLSFLLGPLLLVLARILPSRHPDSGLFEPIAAFAAASIALLVARYAFELDDRVVILSTLIILIPGLSMTTAMTELATRHLVSGVARFAGAAVVFLTILLGVALAWRLGTGPNVDAAYSITPLPDWTLWAAVAATPLAFGIILEARAREFGIIAIASVTGFVASRAAAQGLGTDLSPFIGALVVGVIANLYARLANRPALIPLTPGILMLVPGSLGYRSLTSFLNREALEGMEWAFQTGLVGVSLVGGTLAAGLLLPPRRIL